MITVIQGKKQDDKKTFTLTPEEARRFGRDLMRAAEESEDHGIEEVLLMSEEKRKNDILFRVNPHTAKEGCFVF